MSTTYMRSILRQQTSSMHACGQEMSNMWTA